MAYKSSRKPFLTSSSSTTRLLELIHIDLISPMHSRTDKEKYIFFLLDDYSNCIFLYALEAKFDAYSSFCQFVTFMEETTGCTRRYLCSENNTEFVNNMSQFLAQRVADYQRSAPYTLA
eukprot:TRINITY_DN3007_c0_g1_i1.p1 TRINITY_DN3007_c0_g1~~TRINITY_DN3007_c0_g1_i1.p1  ORF type:complete len:119 (-),score=5.65 TRINITY_DN3007_c0_g1_i1:277-633(-)